MSSQVRLFQRLIVYLLHKKLFELPVERDFANEKAFNAALSFPNIFLNTLF
jgi:hypothetical protein